MQLPHSFALAVIRDHVVGQTHMFIFLSLEKKENLSLISCGGYIKTYLRSGAVIVGSIKKLTISHRHSNHKFNLKICGKLTAMSFASE
jgi:hypothetical protein